MRLVQNYGRASFGLDKMAGKKGMHAKRIRSPSMIENFRAGVSVGLIRKRLNEQALDQIQMKDSSGKPVPGQMSKAALKAAEILLSRCIPTVSSVEMTGKDGGPIESHVTFYLPQNGRGK